METSEYKKIYSGNYIIVERIKNQLGDIGIIPIVKDESESGRLAGFPTAMQDIQDVYVHQDEYAKALPIVDQIKEDTETNNS